MFQWMFKESIHRRLDLSGKHSLYLSEWGVIMCSEHLVSQTSVLLLVCNASEAHEQTLAGMSGYKVELFPPQQIIWTWCDSLSGCFSQKPTLMWLHEENRWAVNKMHLIQIQPRWPFHRPTLELEPESKQAHALIQENPSAQSAQNDKKRINVENLVHFFSSFSGFLNKWRRKHVAEAIW